VSYFPSQDDSEGSSPLPRSNEDKTTEDNMEISKTQAIIMSQLLDIASDTFSNHGCNDFKLDATPENIQFIKNMEIADGEDAEEFELCLTDNRKEFYSGDDRLMRYCHDLLEEGIAQSGKEQS